MVVCWRGKMHNNVMVVPRLPLDRRSPQGLRFGAASAGDPAARSSPGHPRPAPRRRVPTPCYGRTARRLARSWRLGRSARCRRNWRSWRSPARYIAQPTPRMSGRRGQDSQLIPISFSAVKKRDPEEKHSYTALPTPRAAGRCYRAPLRRWLGSRP